MAGPSRMADALPTHRWRLVGRLLRFGVSMLLLAAITWKVQIGSALAALASLSPLAIGALVGVTFACPAIGALRWRRALSYAGVRAPWRMLLADLLVSSAYNMLLPTAVGGDLVRAVRCSQRLREPHKAWSTTIFERLIGIAVLPILAVPGLLLAPVHVRSLTTVVAVVALGSALTVALAPTPFRLGARLLASRAPTIAGAGNRIAADLAGPLASAKARVEMILWSLLYQVFSIGVLVIVVLDWGMPQMTWALFTAIPLIVVATMLPISIGGHGVRESLFVLLLGRFGMTSDRSLSLDLVWLASCLLVALAGVVVMAVESAKRRQASSPLHAQTLPPGIPLDGPSERKQES